MREKRRILDRKIVEGNEVQEEEEERWKSKRRGGMAGKGRHGVMGEVRVDGKVKWKEKEGKSEVKERE
ncbi:hypothetical protein Pmani_037839 [Petrolisthes manimaculis]|uniref:Uncharacterized protein n=1 Tax=Petrolisthes manimaculis TaxID=1843537 RepID=A0AAE1NGG2_9EUCA|nr:hypothetical protein Pmani_037839 [Petrolisthes manimaculis]